MALAVKQNSLSSCSGDDARNGDLSAVRVSFGNRIGLALRISVSKLGELQTLASFLAFCHELDAVKPWVRGDFEARSLPNELDLPLVSTLRTNSGT